MNKDNFNKLILYLPLVLWMCKSTTEIDLNKTAHDQNPEDLLVGKWLLKKEYDSYIREYFYDSANQVSIIFRPDYTYLHSGWDGGKWKLYADSLHDQHTDSLEVLGILNNRFEITKLDTQNLYIRALGRHGYIVYYFKKD